MERGNLNWSRFLETSFGDFIQDFSYSYMGRAENQMQHDIKVKQY